MNLAWDRSIRLLTPALVVLCVIQFATWLPWYLVLPWYADHDVFATMAQGWEVGQLPYRDLIGNNFPGTIYLFWLIGKVFGWGCVPALYAVDAAMLATLGGMLVVWSRNRFGRALPGVVAYVMTLSYYFGLDFSQTAQRDWHASLVVVLGLMAAEVWPNWKGWLLAAIGFTLGLLVRPQMVLLVPAVMMAVAGGVRASGASAGKVIGVVAGWLTVVAGLTVLGFLPLILAGILDDLVNGLRLVAFGSDYNQKSVRMIVSQLFDEVTTFKVLSVAIGVAVLARSSLRGPVRFVAATWLVALAGVSLNAPLSPKTQPYSFHPLWLVWSVNVALVVELILESEIASKWQFLAILLLLGTEATARPRYCDRHSLRKVISALRQGRESEKMTPAYRHPYGFILPIYKDYHQLLEYLRHDLPPGVRIASLLKGAAVTSPTGRLSALPAESATWLYVVNRRDEPRFIKSLEETPNSVVVWDQTHMVDELGTSFPELEKAVRRLYTPDVRFGTIEVWRRRTGTETSPGTP